MPVWCCIDFCQGGDGWDELSALLADGGPQAMLARMAAHDYGAESEHDLLDGLPERMRSGELEEDGYYMTWDEGLGMAALYRRVAGEGGWEEAGPGRWRIAPRDGGFCCEVEASYGWHVQTAPGRVLDVSRRPMPTLEGCLADAASFDPAALEGAVDAGVLAEWRSAPAPEFEQVGESEWAAPLARGGYPRLVATARFYPLYGPYPEGWRKAAGEPCGTRGGAMRACEAKMAEAGW